MVQITLKELRELVVKETTAGWGDSRGQGPVDALAGFRSKKPGGQVGTPSGFAFDKTEVQRAQENPGMPKTHPQLVQAIRELISTSKGIQDPRAIETLYGIIRGAVDNIKTLKTKTGTGFAQGVGRAAAQGRQTQQGPVTPQPGSGAVGADATKTNPGVPGQRRQNTPAPPPRNV